MTTRQSLIRVIGTYVLIFFLWGCTNDKASNITTEIVPIDQLSENPVLARFISIDESALTGLLNQLKEMGVRDSTLRNSAQSLLITSSPTIDGQYLIHPPLQPLYSLFPTEVIAKDSIASFQLKCPPKFKELCDCANNPRPGCPTYKEPNLDSSTKRTCKANLIWTGRFGKIRCNPIFCLSTATPCVTHYDLYTTSQGFKMLTIACYCN